MDYTIASGNKPSSATPQNHAIAFIKMLKHMFKFYSKSKNAKKQEAYGSKSPQLPISRKLIAENPEHGLWSADTETKRNISY